jgi:hypothetical protein
MQEKIALMMEAASTFETSVNFYQTTWRNNPEEAIFKIVVRWLQVAKFKYL